MELKTLKDLEDFPDLSHWKLKQEAIKWVEFLQTTPVSFEDEQVIEFIKLFFNIEL